ncbi:hypothetical protein KUTeg_013216 [Tegillarca granosa]|uniref:Bromodomain adjacent to zinc finger domain protein 1A n=1 Tax=Tegillarca granosa TaxID=220873 RepID=A0ABQ9EWI3_TEGGR|nr:hypothetical protein KUTeg_013216 [Tegillarca granosa]
MFFPPKFKMPHLRRQPFHRQKPPPDLRPDEYVFHCKLTNEIFRDYEEFFERIILCNSLVWSCSITGRAGLTYQEAVECEEKALKNLATFPSYLQKPVLYLATLTHRSRLVDMNDDIFMFVKDRYFIGEMVEVMIGGERRTCKIVRVVSPSVGSDSGCIVIDDDDEDDAGKPKGTTLPADQYRYVVQEKGKSNITITVPAKQVSRKKGVYTRDKCKLFLKQHSEPTDGIWKLKPNTAVKKGIDSVGFQDFFAGPVPAFGYTESKRKSGGKKEEDIYMAPGPSDHCDYQKKKKKQKEDSKKKKDKEEEIANQQEVVVEPPKLSAEERKALQEQFKQQKLAEKMAKKEEMKQKMMEEREKKKEEKAKEREKMMEEKRIKADFLREWSKPRDDLDCDDLKVLPDPSPIRLRIPTETFGDAVMIVEFINCFKALFDLKEYFPKGFNIGVLEKALIETDHNGILTDILLMMMTAIFTLQEEEEEEEQQLSKKGKKGCILKKLPLDSFTLSEILRLHLMSSGAAANEKNAKYRFQMRGGYTSLDDPGLEFRRQEPALLRDKIKLLKVLVHQFLTYAATRDTLEDNYEKVKQVRLELKQFPVEYRRRMEERAKEREKLEKKRLKKMKEMEAKLKREEAAKEGRHLEEPMEENEEEEDDEPLMTEEEKEELRQQEEEEEADKKADFAIKEKKYLHELSQLQHGNAIYPLGRDRMYRRYWVFQSLPGLFVEDCEEHVDQEDLRPVPQNPNSNPFQTGNPIPVPKKANEENGSDKENESFNTSTANNSLNVSNLNTSQNVSNNTSLVGTPDVGIVNGSTDGQKTTNDDSGPPTLVKDEEPMQVDNKVPPIVESLAVKQILDRQKFQWSYFTSVDQIDELIESLNSRGFREGALKLALLEQKNRIVELVDKCPQDQLTTGKSGKVERMEEEIQAEQDDTEESDKNKTEAGTTKVKWTKKGLIRENCAQEVLELNLRELLLDLEERIYAGSLGMLKVKDRHAWRDAIEKGNYDPQTDDPTYANSDDSQESTIKDLAKSLLQIERSIEAKYLVHPLERERRIMEEKRKRKKRKGGKRKEKEQEKNREENEDSDDEEEKPEEPKVQERTTLQRWEDSLLYCSSLSQIFLHLGTLEKSIAWSKSALHTRCRICRKKGDADKMLLCDIHLICVSRLNKVIRALKHECKKLECPRDFNSLCIYLVIKTVPQGDWFCPDCRPKETKRSPRKGRRRTFSEKSEEEDAAEVEEEEEENKAGMLILCDTCPLAYHLGCADPPLKKVPRGRWLCQLCSGHGKAGKIKLPKDSLLSFKSKFSYLFLNLFMTFSSWFITNGGKKKGMKVTPVSSRASSRQESPRDSPVTVNSRKSRKRANSASDDEAPRMKKNSRSTSKLLQDINGGPKHYVSSSRGNTKVTQLKSCEEIVNEVMKIDECLPFLKPVSKKLVPDYFDIITHPMDFGTIRNKINRFMYKEPSEMISDVRQIFTNCFEYNKKTTQEFKAGLSLSKLFEKRLKEINISMDDDTSGASSSKRSRRTL